MEQHTLWVEPRKQTGKGVNRKIRKAGKIPAVLYGMGSSQPVVVDPVVVNRNLLNMDARNWVYSIEEGALKGKNILIKDWQVDPLSRRLIHVDLLEIDITKKIRVTVKLTLVGKAIGVAEGGVLNIIERSIEVECQPNKIPTHIDVDVTNLAIGRSIHLSEIQLPEGVEKTLQTDPTLVACVPPTKEEDAVASLTAAADPEVLTAKKPAEGEEGAAPAAGAKAEEKKDEKKK